MSSILKKCNQCPRECMKNNKTDYGYCRISITDSVASVSVHTGEEPVLCGTKGICNVFFLHCNLQCVFCQNHQISYNSVSLCSSYLTLKQVVDDILNFLQDGGTHVGFVSASHCIETMIFLIKEIRVTGFQPVFVYNTNAYDKVETIEMLDDYIDVFLPDFKYASNELGSKLSDVVDYFTFAQKSIQKMLFLKGTSIQISDTGLIEKGVIIRHLVLPSFIQNSIALLRFIEEEFSNRTYVSLMAQYHPMVYSSVHENLNRKLLKQEYDFVLEEFYRLGFTRGWTQDLESSDEYLPDFDLKNPFEKKSFD